MRQRDVLIVGGGPAGAWAGRTLARAGARVTLFDASHPREKPCGGGLTARTLALLAVQVPDALVGAASVTSLRFEAARSHVEFPFPAGCDAPDQALVVVNRQRFDAALLCAAVQAGVVHVNERVRDIEVVPGRIKVTTTSSAWEGDHLIGADGATSLIRRRVHGPFSKTQTSLATGYFAYGVRSSEIRIRAISDPPGYIWSFPRTDHLAVGICAQTDASTVPQLRQIVSEWMKISGLAEGARLQPYSWPIPSVPAPDFAREPVARGRCLLVGDAAGLVDPLTREGIYFALYSAECAAFALSRDGDPGALYGERIRSEIHPELVRAARLKERFFTSGFGELMVSGLARSAGVRQVMVDLVAGRQPYATLKRRLLRTREVHLALELLWLHLTERFAGDTAPGT